MSILDALLGRLSHDIDIDNLATKVGLDPGQVEHAIQALGVAHPEPGDTVETAAAQTGLSAEVLQQIVSHIGGEGALGQFASLLQSEGVAGKIGGLVSGLFGKS